MGWRTAHVSSAAVAPFNTPTTLSEHVCTTQLGVLLLVFSQASSLSEAFSFFVHALEDRHSWTNETHLNPRRRTSRQSRLTKPVSDCCSPWRLKLTRYTGWICVRSVAFARSKMQQVKPNCCTISSLHDRHTGESLDSHKSFSPNQLVYLCSP